MVDWGFSDTDQNLTSWGAATTRAAQLSDRAHGRQASDAERRITTVIVLGIDPGLASTGYGVVHSTAGRLVALDGGVIETRAGASQERRLADIHAAVDALLVRARARRDGAGGAVLRAERENGVRGRPRPRRGDARGRTARDRVHELHAQQVKAAVCGNGRADKDQVARMVQTLLALPQPPTPDHAADALAVAMCHANRAPLSAALAGVAA